MTTRSERHYRRLLRAYPRSYRDHRGTEILTTLLEMAEDGRRPGLHLVLSGLWQRFKLPARRPLAWVAALLAAAVLGGFGAAAGTWIAWQTAAAIPSDRKVQALNTGLTGIPGDAPLYHETSAQQGPSVAIQADGTAGWSSARIRDALTGAGWRITSFRESEGRTIPREDMTAAVPIRYGTWTATSGGLRLWGDARVLTGAPFTDAASYNIRVWPVEPAPLRPLTIAGTVAGLLTGWLLVTALARRRLATALATGGFIAATLLAYEFYRDACEVMAYPHGSPRPGNVDTSHGGTFTLICTIIGLFAIAAAVIAARPGPAGAAGQPRLGVPDDGGPALGAS
ncbi:hypothetical protein [Paractinoplanes durhamensis]|uniref:Uncharacterized protein n=1 Tax=Paractinoplanes durhamensis TaxID=113563 RepID=A0ABQ3YVK7_9ACTN|nr:hypothetical protein [Actinoplanes durhamensis]GIE01623.1 hypothetical protein Adu01nite_29730 [Actinoplanes durhamensis]